MHSPSPRAGLGGRKRKATVRALMLAAAAAGPGAEGAERVLKGAYEKDSLKFLKT